MSYRNPQGNVDRQSGQYIRQMQQEITQGVDKYAKGLAEKRKEEQEALKQQIKDNEALSLRQDEFNMQTRASIATALGEVKSKSPFMALQMREQIMSDLDEASKYIGKTNLTEEQKQMIINLKQAPDTIKKFAIDTGTFGGDLSKQLKNQGNFGGLDPTYDSKQTETFLGLTGDGSVPGQSYWKMDLSGTEGPVVMMGFKKEGEEETRWINSNQYNKLAEAGESSAVAILRDAGPDMQSMINSALMGNAEGKGKIKGEYWENQKAEKIGDVEVGGVITGERQSLTINKELLKQNIKEQVLADVNNTSVTNQNKVGWYNMFERKLKKDKAQLIPHGKLLTEEQNLELADLYADYAMEFYLPPEANIVSTIGLKDNSSGNNKKLKQQYQKETTQKLVDEVYDAVDKKDKSYFVGAKYNGEEITNVDFSDPSNIYIEFWDGNFVDEPVLDEKGKETGKFEKTKKKVLTAPINVNSGNSMANLFKQISTQRLGKNEEGIDISEAGMDFMRQKVNENKPKGNRFGGLGSTSASGSRR